MRVIDIGCGPGHILRHLPEGIEYTGFDIDEAYIAYARRCSAISAPFIPSFRCRRRPPISGADVVMMNGVLHHIADDGLQATLADIHNVLKSDGVLFTLDGCYHEGKSASPNGCSTTTVASSSASATATTRCFGAPSEK